MLTQRIGFNIILTSVTIAFVAIMLPFYSAILWAVIFAIVFFPVHARIENRLRDHRNIAAALSVLTCVCLVIVPGIVIFSALIRQGSQLYQYLQGSEIDIPGLFSRFVEMLPAFVRDRLRPLDPNNLSQLRDYISSALLDGGGFFAGRMLSFGQNTLHLVLAFGIMIYLLFFLFRDGRELTGVLRRSSPLTGSHTRRFTSKFTSVVRATVRGNFIIAVIQGTIGGLSFWALGIRPALLWGFTMSVMSLVPAVGAAVIWIPAAIYLALSGLWAKAVILVLIGVLVIGLVDNLLRPPLVGQEARLPDYMVLLSTVGGIALMGVNGFVVGPLIAALFISAWSIFIDESHATETTGDRGSDHSQSEDGTNLPEPN